MLRSRGARRAVLGGALCALVLGCHPEDANVGGSWACPENLDRQCFFYDSGLQVQPASAAATALRALFDVPEDPDASKAPRIAYPLDQTTEPSNIFDLDIQWHRLDGTQTLFRIRVESPSLPWGRYDLYTQCFPSNDGCHYSVPDADRDGDQDSLLWYKNVLLPLKGQDAVLTVAGSDGKGGPISVSPPVHFRVSRTSVPGGLYYWSAHPPGAPPGSGDQGTTYRLAIGARTAAPFIRPGKENPDTCEGCHAVSRQGNKIAFTATDVTLGVDGAQAGTFFSRNTSSPLTGSAAADPPQSATIALNEDGSLAVIGRENELWLRHTDNSMPDSQIDPVHFGQEGEGYFPDFSPDGNRIAVTLSDHPDSAWAVSTGSIATLEFDGTNFSDAQVLVPMTDQEFHFYPSWSPDGNWIVFASAPRAEDPVRCMGKTPCPNISYDQANARLRVAHFPDGRTYDLTRATQGIGFTSTMPKFATTVAERVNEMFITFNSKMPYGIEVPSNAPAQLWLSVLDFDRLPDDPSSAPVWLPFQSFGQKNHLAYWTDFVPCRKDLTAEEACGPDELCVADLCQPNTPVK